MTDKATLLDLAARCEAATGKSAQLDADIYRALKSRKHPGHTHFPYTASLDAAMALVPEGWHILFLSEDRYTKRPMLALGRVGDTSGEAAPCDIANTLALALCAASLRALAMSAKDNGQ